MSALEESGNVSAAAKVAGIHRDTAYAHKEKDEAFAARWEAALEIACDALELEARRRAAEGLVRYKFNDGKPILDPVTKKPYFEREYSDTLLIFLLKAHRPEKFRETVRSVNLNLTAEELAKLPDDELDRLIDRAARRT